MSVEATVFIDRDGVINANRPDHVKCWREFQFLPGALPAVAMLSQHGFNVVVVTNQSVINRRLMSLAELGRVHSRMCTAMRQCGGRVRAVLHCPHRPEENCPCRKPRPGLLLRAKSQLGVDLETAIVVGDHVTDLEAARRAGCRSLLVTCGRPIERPHDGLPDGCIGIVPDLMAAAERIIADYQNGAEPNAPWLANLANGCAPAQRNSLQEARA